MVGQVVRDQKMEEQARDILKSMHFIGPVNLQCFKTAAGNFFTEINPRLAGGMSLSMHATTNWFRLVPAIFSQDSIAELAVQYGLTMMRSFQDVVVSQENLLA
jgi:carbamoylphosphate synthase large subunit